MSQEDVRYLLTELGGKASLPELSDLAAHEFPNRTLHKYVKERLEGMKQKGLVRTEDYEGVTKWILTEKGKSAHLETTIDSLGSTIDESSLSSSGITISNVVGLIDLQQDIDLLLLSEELSNVDYHPETYHSAIFRPNEDSSITIIIPSSGRVSIAGGKSKKELTNSIEAFLDKLTDIGIPTNKSPDDIIIQNIVANFDFNREFELNSIAIELGLERTEYDPEQFPGLVYRSSKNAAVLLFTSGKCVITGARCYNEVFVVAQEIVDNLSQIGVDLSDPFQL